MVYKPYVPSYASLTPSTSYAEVSTGYTLSASRIGAPTKPDTANQIAEVTARLNEGMTTVEMGVLGPEVFETIPKQQFKEMNQLARLTGSEITVHAPLVDPAGFSQEGHWSEANREEAERRLTDIMLRSHQLNEKGNVPVTIHSTATQIPAWTMQKTSPEGGKSMMVIINKDTGEAAAVRREEKHFPGEKSWSMQRQLEDKNKEVWENMSHQADYYQERAAALMGGIKELEARRDVIEIFSKSGEELTPEEQQRKEILQNRRKSYLEQANRYLEYADRFVREGYNLVHKYEADPKKKKILEAESEDYGKYVQLRNELAERRKGGVDPTDRELREINEKGIKSSEKVLDGLRRCDPKIYVPIEEFSIDKSAETIGNVAFNAFSKYKEKAPIIALENVFPEMPFSTADQLRNLVEASRDEFVERAVNSPDPKIKLKREDAEKMADKLIGVTWDVGHINLLRKAGYAEQEIVEQTKKIAPYVKKMHITDNFGYADTHLAPGMGNVPIKKIMEEMEKAGYSGKSIMEAGGFVQHFKTSPHPYALEALGAPIYSESSSPAFGAARGAAGSYFSGYGPFLPEQNFSMYGTGFSGLPSELGGQIPGRQSRLSGTPVD